MAPSGHAAVNQFGVVLQQRLGTQTQPLHHARSKPLDDAIGGFAKIAHRFNPGRVLQVDNHEFPRASKDIFAQIEYPRTISARGHDPDHLRSMIREHHRAKWGGSNCGDLDYFQPNKRSANAHFESCVKVAVPMA